MKSSLYIILALCALLYPAASISRWFTSSYYDVRATMRRYARCESSLAPLKKHNASDTDFLVDQIRLFLDQANYDNEQLANITALMGYICRSGEDSDYPVSINIDVSRYSNGTKGKAARCKGIDRTMDAMFGVFKRAALNKSEPLDFSTIQFDSDFDTTTTTTTTTTTVKNDSESLGNSTFRNNSDASGLATMKNNTDIFGNTTIKNNTDNLDGTFSKYYNVTDLINTLWISSDFPLDQTCNITRKIIEYVQLRTSNSTAQDRSQTIAQSPQGYYKNLLEFLDRLLDPILGLQKRFYWEGSNRVEIIYIGIGNQLGQLRQELGKVAKGTRDRLSNAFNYSTAGSSNSTAGSSNSTAQTVRSSLAFNSTLYNQTVNQNVTTFNINSIGGLVENSTNLTIPQSLQPQNASAAAAAVAAMNNLDKTVYSQ